MSTCPPQTRKEQPLQVFVRDNNIEQALRALKRKMQREGVFREMRRRRFYEKPSERAAREKTDAVRRLRKLARKQAIRDGLIAPKPKDKKGDGKRPPLSAERTRTGLGGQCSQSKEHGKSN